MRHDLSLGVPEFAPALPRPRLADGDVDVWRIDVDAPGADVAVLDEGERARAMRFRHARERQRYIAAHVAMRDILARYLRCAPAAVYFEADGDNGKVRLCGASAPAINLAHSGSIALLCVAGLPHVGIDVEAVRELVDLRELVLANFTRIERAQLHSHPDPAAAFFRIWTRKEALLKALGTGLTVELRGVEVAASERIEYGDNQWELESFTAGPGCLGALALPWPRNQGARRYFEFTPAFA